MESKPEPIFLRIPSELRLQVYNYLIPSTTISIPLLPSPPVWYKSSKELRLKLVCKKMYLEVKPMFAQAIKILVHHRASVIRSSSQFYRSMDLVPRSYLQNIEWLMLERVLLNIDFKRYLPKLNCIRIGSPLRWAKATRENISFQMQKWPSAFQGMISHAKEPISFKNIDTGVKVIRTLIQLLFSLDRSRRTTSRLDAINVSYDIFSKASADHLTHDSH
jgi:hypothetical protein